MSRKNIKQLHIASALTSTLVVATFQAATVMTEAFGDLDDIQMIKLFILVGLPILIPAMISTGITGNALKRTYGTHSSPLLLVKMQRMKWAALNGVFVLIPCAVFLYNKAMANELDVLFWTVQIIEIIAGMTNLLILIANARIGRQLKYNLSNSA